MDKYILLDNRFRGRQKLDQKLSNNPKQMCIVKEKHKLAPFRLMRKLNWLLFYALSMRAVGLNFHHH